MKKMMRRVLCLVLALALCMGCCGAYAQGYPVAITDHAGRTVTIEDAPSRIVSGYYISTSMLIALGQEEKLVGIEAKADKRPIYRLSAPQLIELPSVGTAKAFDLEGCAALMPDLVILPLKLKDAAQTLTDLGMDVLLVNPENQALLEEAMTMAAQATGSQARLAQLLDFVLAQRTRLETQLSGAPRPTVYLAGNSSLLSTSGDGMYQSDMIRLAGGANAAASIPDSDWAKISYEQLLAWDPDVILLASDAVYSCEDVLADENLGSCAAVKNGRVYQMPGDAEAWDSPVPSGVLGAVWLASVLHPQICSAQEADAVAKEFYETFYGFAYGQ